jgi:type II secretory pathway pseudopilin PulG
MNGLNAQKGMTLIEAMVWIAIFIAAMIALTTSLISFYRANSFAIKDAAAIQSAQHAMDTAVRAIRTASYSNNGAYPIISIAANQISFYANVTKGDPYTQKIRFFTQGNSFKEGVIEPTGDPPAYTGTEIVTSLSDYVQNITVATSTFFYYDQNGMLINDYTQFQKVRFVTVNLVVDASTSSLPTQLTLISSAALRNLITH